MSDFSFLALPNIEGMRVGWYIQIFGIVIFFGVCLFFVLYFRIKYRRTQQLLQNLKTFDQRTKELEQDLFLQRIHTSSGKLLVILFIEYLEKFITSDANAKALQAYANLSDLLIPQGFTQKEAEELSKVLYTDKKLSHHLEDKIHHYFNFIR